MKEQEIKFGQVWKAIRDYKITMYSPYEGCVIPKNARVVVLNTPVTKATGFDIMSLTSKELDKKLTPNLKLMESIKEGFGITVNIEYFKKYFVLDSDQRIEFDNSDATEFWKDIMAARSKK